MSKTVEKKHVKLCDEYHIFRIQINYGRFSLVALVSTVPVLCLVYSHARGSCFKKNEFN